MPAPLDPEKRAAIEDAIRHARDTDPPRSSHHIAQEHGVAQSTVARIAKQLEAAGQLPGPAWDRTKTENASRARATDNAARRADLEARFLDAAVSELDALKVPTVVGQFGGRDNVWSEREFALPPHNVRATLVATAARAAKAAADLAGAGQADPAEQGKAAVLQLVDAIRGRNTPDAA